MMDKRYIEKIWAEVEPNTHNMTDRQVAYNIDQWVKHVRGNVIDLKRRPVPQIRGVPMHWVDEHVASWTAMDYNKTVKTEEVMVVEIPVRELDSMAKTQEWFSDNIGGYSMAKFDHIIRKNAMDESLREKHPGLQEAWENYQIMLKLCDDQTFD